ncbi:MAG: DnaA N-terminal domain-containing protein, partial [Bacteroidota bacterium]
MQAEELWQRALPILKTRVSPPNFEAWVRPARVIALEDRTLFIETPSEFAREWINKNLLGDFHQALTEAGGAEYSLSFRVADLTPLPGAPDVAAPVREELVAPTPKDGILIPKYTFDTFVVGNHNRFA